MPTPTKGPRLGGGPAHERLILANLAQALFEHDRITTTEAKAKRLRPLAERLVTFAKRGDLHARRRVLTVIRDKGVVHRLFTEIAPDVAERQGGYTRITKIGPRKGDNAPMAVIELVREPLSRQAGHGPRGRGGDQAGGQEVGRQEGHGQEGRLPAAEADRGRPRRPRRRTARARTPRWPTARRPRASTSRATRTRRSTTCRTARTTTSTVAEVWFATTEAAETAGFEPTSWSTDHPYGEGSHGRWPTTRRPRATTSRATRTR